MVHHADWLKHLAACQRHSKREGIRFLSVSQPYAGTFLNAVPKHKPFRVPTWALRFAIQRRLGLTLLFLPLTPKFIREETLRNT